METFLTITFSFPTVIFTVLLAVAVIYWLISLLGIAGDTDIGDGDLIDGDIDASTDFGGLMVTLGLHGVPLPLVLTLLFLGGWSLSYFADLLLGQYLGDGIIRVLFIIATVPFALVGALFLTSFLIRPLRPLFRRAFHQPLEKRIVGAPCVIVSSSVSTSSGRAEAMLDGAHLILQVRSDHNFSHRDRAVLVEYLSDQKAYWVIPEAEFQAGAIPVRSPTDAGE